MIWGRNTFSIAGQEQTDVTIDVLSLPFGEVLSVPFSLECLHILIKPPTDTAQFSIQVDYPDGFPFFKFPQDNTLFQKKSVQDVVKIMVGNFNIYITDCTETGIYTLRFVGRKAFV
ncbi:MAG: hypothetical protein A3F67_05190 [Verrucomicrobia bacterium RIFCSPHIGHO2_12_FULL_41_10]|nr:MAG: hypothetical protein A3F67_05190 [Verrucomicrobia bacterium RIFCSPHIGHO2_12_FULL_41_10]